MKINSIYGIKLNWPKILLSLTLLLFIIIMGYAVYLYQAIIEDKTADFQLTEQRINQELDMTSIDKISRYHGTEYFHVVEGKTADQEEVVIFVNQTDETADLIQFSIEDWVPDKQIIDQWKQDNPYQEIYQIQYGIRSETPLIEIVYLDQSDRLSYDYYRLDNGEYDSGLSIANKSK